jgi:hypothetical protein
MGDKLFNPASTNTSSPAPGMAAVNTDNSEEMDTALESVNEKKEEPKDIDRERKKDADENNKALRS